MVSRKFPVIVIMKIHLLKEMVEYTHSRLKKKKKQVSAPGFSVKARSFSE